MTEGHWSSVGEGHSPRNVLPSGTQPGTPPSRRRTSIEGAGESTGSYVIANIRITNEEAFAEYPLLALPTISAHDGQILVGDFESEMLEGTANHLTVVIRFASTDAARAWYESDNYQAIKSHRTDNSEGFVMLCDELNMPS